MAWVSGTHSGSAIGPLRCRVFRPLAGVGRVPIDTRYVLAAARPALRGGPRVSLPVPMLAIGDDRVTVYAGVEACLVHTVMIDR